MIKILKFFFSLFFLSLLVIPVALVVFSIEPEARVINRQKLSFDQVKQVKQLIDRSRPRYLKRKQIRQIRVSEKQLNLLISYGLSQVLNTNSTSAQIKLDQNRITVDISKSIPDNPLGNFINLSVSLKTSEDFFDLESLKIGRVFIPGWLARPIFLFIHKTALNLEAYQELAVNKDAIRKVSVSPDRMIVVYDWNPDAMAKLQEKSKTLLLSVGYQDKLVFYHNQLSDVLKPYQKKRISLARILPVMFEKAQKQSEITKDPVSENRALLQVLALYANRTSLAQFIDKDIAEQLVSMVSTGLMLNSRKDLAKHYLISSGLSVSGGSGIANFIGLAKEVDDSDGGSGFSFADLAADRAGVRLAEIAVKNHNRAALLQNQMKNVKYENEFMPPTDQLPEAIMALEFKNRYVDFDSDTYKVVDFEIERRIKMCRVFQ